MKMNSNGNVSLSKRGKNRGGSGGNSNMSSIHNRPMNRSMRNSGGNNYSYSSRDYPPRNQNQNHHNSNSSSGNNSQVSGATRGNTSAVVANHSSINDMANGVYKNQRLMHAITSLIGTVVEVKLVDGRRYEGVLMTFSPFLELVMCSAIMVSENVGKRNTHLSNNIGNLLSSLNENRDIEDKVVIDAKNIANFKAINVDIDFAAAKSVVLTDGEIAKNDGTKSTHRELVPWNDDGEVTTDICLDSLDSSMSNGGWRSDDMFKFNQNKFNITSTYDDSMTGYTIGIDHREDDEFKQREAQAARIAREIEGDAHRVQRYAKEDELDEEALYSAVIRGDSTDEPNPSAVPYNHSGFKGEMNHSRGDSDRSGPSGGRDSMRNTDNSGFRTQNSRQGRRGMGDRDRDRDRGRQGGGGANEPNWREAASSNRMNAARYHGGPGGGNQSAAPYNSSGPGKASGSSQYGPSKYSTSAGSGGSGPASSNQFSQPITPASARNVPISQSKTSYSAVSARNVPPEPDNDREKYSNRGGGGKDHYPGEDSYSRRSAGGIAQRDNFNKQRNFNRGGDTQESIKSTSRYEMEHSKPSVQPSLPPTSTTTTQPDTKKSDSGQPKVTRSLDEQSTTQSNSSTSASAATNRTISPKTSSLEQNKKHEVSPTVESGAKPPQSTSQTTLPSNPPTKETQPEPKKNLTLGGDHTQSKPAPAPSTSPAASSVSTNTPSASPATSCPEEIIKSSTLNPNAKSFTPRALTANTPAVAPAPTQTSYMPTGQVVGPSAYHGAPYQSQHLSTTPPSIPSTPSMGAQPNQYIQFNHPGAHIPAQLHPQHQQPQHIARYNTMQFQAYALPPQMVPPGTQYIVQTLQPNSSGVPSAVFATPLTVPGSAPPQSSGPPNGAGPSSGPITSHHMIPNSSASGQGPPSNSAAQSNQQGQNQSRPYRGNKSGAGQNSGQPSQQYMRQQHHSDYAQASQVASVTGQPIMAAAAPPQIPVAYSTAAAPHHHAQSQLHGQQAQNMAAAQLGPQPGANQQLYISYPPYRPIMHQQSMQALAAQQIHPGIHYQPETQMIFCDGIPQMVAQPMPPGAVQANPNMQPAVSNGTTGVPAPVPPSNTPATSQPTPAPPQPNY